MESTLRWLIDWFIGLEILRDFSKIDLPAVKKLLKWTECCEIAACKVSIQNLLGFLYCGRWVL